jgi:hypothetical protein
MYGGVTGKAGDRLPMSIDAPSGHIGADGRQSEEGGPTRGACVLSFVEGLTQGPPADESTLPWARRQASDYGRRTFQGLT